MNRNLPMLGSNGQGEVAAEKWHEALLRLSKRQDRDSTIPPDKRTLGTHYPDRFEESTSLPVFADEGDELPKLRSEHRKDSKVAIALVWLIAFCAVFVLLKLKFGW